MYYVWPYDVFLQSSIIPIEQRLVGCLNQLNANKNCYLSQLFPPHSIRYICDDSYTYF